MFCVFLCLELVFVFFFFNDTATTEIYTLSLHDALPIWRSDRVSARLTLLGAVAFAVIALVACTTRSEEHTSELQSHVNLVCRLLLEKKKTYRTVISIIYTST